MQLVETDNYEPQQHALFPCHRAPLLAVHPSTRLMAFQTRNHEIILRNTATGRNTVLIKSPHPFKSLAFTHRYLIASQQTCHDVIVFSLKSEKLKSRLGGHRAEVTQVAYCRQNELIASISHDLCLVHSERSLTHLKTLKCSTSSFVDCGFGLNGGLLATSFKDGTVLLWDPLEWEHRSSAVIATAPRVAIGGGTVLAVYDNKRLWLTDASKPKPVYQELNPFWEGSIKEVVFIEHYLILNAESGLFIMEIKLDNSFKIIQVKRVSNCVASLAHTQYQSILATLSQNAKVVQFLRLDTPTSQLQKLPGSPLTNEGLVCAGGYSTEAGCFVSNGQTTSNAYGKVELRVEPMLEGCYAEVPDSVSLPKLKDFLRKHYALPDKYRPIAYRYALQLPVAPASFRDLERKGLHTSTELLENNYPLSNGYLADKMRQVMSLLAHWSPVMGVSEAVPAIVFPFVCLFGEDTFMCFEVLYRLFSGPLAFMFHTFPLANAGVLQNIWEVLKREDAELVAHLEGRGISFTRLSWSLISSLFTTAVNREGFLAVVDHILVRVDEPEMVLFLCLGYLIFNRKRILSAGDERTARLVCEEEQTIHLGKYINLMEKLHAKYKGFIRYPLKTGLSGGIYEELECPPDAVKMHGTKERILVEELRKQKEAEAHREQMLQEMQTMTVAARREAERQLLEQQAYKMHCEEQENYNVKLREIDRTDRIVMLEQMMGELTQALEGQKAGRELLRQYVPAVENLTANTDAELHTLEVRLMKLLSEVRPATSLKHLASQPVNVVKREGCSEGLEGAVGARLANRLWELDTLAHRNQAVLCENRVLSSMRP